MDTPKNEIRPVAVVAFGGNTLVQPDEEGHVEEQLRNAEHAAEALTTLLARDHELLVVHGNGPQVGHELLRQEESSTKMPAMPLDACVANTQGAMGYLLERAFRNHLTRSDIHRNIATLMTQVVVDPRDTAFQEPTKPIGPYYTPYRARQLMKEKGWTLVEEEGRGYRMVVPSPRPLRVLGIDAAQRLLAAGYVVVVGGGGGVPVAHDPLGELHGIEAVIDKDLTASLIARQIRAETLILLTNVEQVSIHYNTPRETKLGDVSLEEMTLLHEAGHFGAGSMGPKVLAGIEFLKAGGGTVLITSERHLERAMDGEGGTRITNPGAFDETKAPPQLALKL